MRSLEGLSLFMRSLFMRSRFMRSLFICMRAYVLALHFVDVLKGSG